MEESEVGAWVCWRGCCLDAELVWTSEGKEWREGGGSEVSGGAALGDYIVGQSLQVERHAVNVRGLEFGVVRRVVWSAKPAEKTIR